MSLEAIKAEMAELPREQQDHLAAFLVHLRHQRNPSFSQEISSRLEDQNPKNSFSLDEPKKSRSDNDA